MTSRALSVNLADWSTSTDCVMRGFAFASFPLDVKVRYLNDVSILDTLLETEKKALAKATDESLTIRRMINRRNDAERG